MPRNFGVAVVGATGVVGRELIGLLHDRRFPVSRLHALASKKSIGRKVDFGQKHITVDDIDDFDFNGVDIAFLCAGSKVSKKYLQKILDAGTTVIDKASLNRMNPDVPLVVPEVNKNLIDKNQKLISSPNCCVIPLALVLGPIDRSAHIKRVVISTYQSVSGAGSKGMEELYNATKGRFMEDVEETEVFPREIAFNVIPQIGDFDDNGYTDEEIKISQEIKKILGNHIGCSVTSVRVPVFIGHAMSVNIECEKTTDPSIVTQILQNTQGVCVADLGDKSAYITPSESSGQDEVFVSRIRDDNSRSNSVNMWVSVDNLRKGAALNAVQIAETLIKYL